MAWFGLIVVVQNIVGSLFNSHISDFTQGWIYVFGVGVLGGALRPRSPRTAADMMPAPAKSTALREMPEPSRVLVITLRRLGDALLTTPLIRTLRRGYPGARLDVLAFRGGEGILAGNPDIDAVITMPERPSPRETAALVAKLWRRYDLVVSTQSGDRPTFYAMVAGRYRIGLVPPEGKTGARWKRSAYHVAIVPDPETHRIAHLRLLTDALGLPFVPDLVCPQGEKSTALPRAPYAVLHANPAYRYKRWTDEGWRGLARGLAERGLTVAVTGGPGAAERGVSRPPVGAGRACGDAARWAARLAAACRTARRRCGVCRGRYLHEPSGCSRRLPHRRALWADQPASDRPMAGRRPDRALGTVRDAAAARQRRRGAESAALPAVRETRLRRASRQLQPLPR